MAQTKTDTVKYRLRICAGPECRNCGSDELFKKATKMTEKHPHIIVEKRSCMGRCESAANLQVMDSEGKEIKHHSKTGPNDLPGIIESLPI